MNGIYCYKDTENENKVVYVRKDFNIEQNMQHIIRMSKEARDKESFNALLQDNPERYKYEVLIEGVFSPESLNELESHFKKMYSVE